MDFASPVAASTAGEQFDSFTTGKTFATWTFDKAKNPFATKRQAVVPIQGETAARYREAHHPTAPGDGLRP